MFQKFLNKFSKKIAIDLGTSKTVVSVQDRGIIIQEPSIVAINNRLDRILAVGEDARKMVGKAPKFITLSRPLENGIISDFEVTEKMLRYFIDKIYREQVGFAFRPGVVINIPLDITEVEKKAVEDAVLSAGAGKVHLVEEVMASALGARLPVQDASGSLIVNLGGGKTEIAVISLNGVVNWKSLKIAGQTFDQDIINYARDHFNLLIGERFAEQLKINIGSAFEIESPMQMEMRGRDLVSGLPRELVISDYQVRDAISPSINAIIEALKLTLETTPPELVADIYERGIVLAGGGAKLRGIDKAISKAAAVPVRIADDPVTCTIRGLNALLEDNKLLEEVEVPSASADRIL
ncbi:MAG: rod shape-determining protein [Candidatus Falkowbacteria bacterium]